MRCCVNCYLGLKIAFGTPKESRPRGERHDERAVEFAEGKRLFHGGACRCRESQINLIMALINLILSID